MTDYLKKYWNKAVTEADDIFTDHHIYQSADKADHFRQGFWDFSHYILNPVMKLGVTPGDTALEIGCGLGRLILPASLYFNQAIGIDISEEVLKKAQEEMDFWQRKNVKLLPCDGATIPVEDQAVKFVFSFIVMIHIPSKAVVLNYIRESYRVLMPGGVLRLQVRKSESAFRSVDNVQVGAEDYNISKGCTFIDRELKKAVEDAGFKALAVHTDTRKPYNNVPSKTQLWVTAVKPE